MLGNPRGSGAGSWGWVKKYVTGRDMESLTNNDHQKRY